MSFRNKVANLGKTPLPVLKLEISVKTEPKYIFFGVFAHGEYGTDAVQSSNSRYSSVTLTSVRSIPTLMTYLSCSPGNSLIGDHTGMDNILLTDFFEANGDVNLVKLPDDMPKINDNGKTQDNLISFNLLDYINAALGQLPQDPRNRNERYRMQNPIDPDIPRNNFICNGRIGISHTFPNKSFYTNQPPSGRSNRFDITKNWGIFVYNNNCGIEPGTNIIDINEINKEPIDNNGQITGLEFTLNDIISGLTRKYNLMETDYVFFMDYSCNNFNKGIQGDDRRSVTRLGLSITRDFGFGGRKKNKRTKKNRKNRRTKKSNKSKKTKTK
jgi:hypothetical protein